MPPKYSRPPLVSPLVSVRVRRGAGVTLAIACTVPGACAPSGAAAAPHPVPAPAPASMAANPAPTPNAPRPETPNARLIRRYFEEVWNDGRLEVLDELVAPTYVNHSPGLPDPAPGPAGLKPIVAAMRRAFPDLHYAVLDVVDGGDRVAVRVEMSGTHTGDFFGTPATGRRVRVAQFQIERVEPGPTGPRLVEHWRQTDDLGLMRQLGLLQEQ